MKLSNTLLLLLASLSLLAQEYSKELFIQDLELLKSEIQTYNPALKNYNPDFEVKSTTLISEAKERSKDYTAITAYKYISQLCALSNEGHFSVGKWSDDVHLGFMENEYEYLPISIKISQGKSYIWIDNSFEQSLSRGDEIVSINRLGMTEVLEEIRRALPTDGTITTYTDRIIERGFSWMFYLFVSQSRMIDIAVKDASGETQTHTIKGLTRKVQFENYDKYYPDRDPEKEENSFYSLNYEESTAFLRLPSFDFRKIEKYKIKSENFYAEIFEDLIDRDIKNLVIDLRGNTGGRNEMADDMVPYIIKNDQSDPFLKKSISWNGKTKTYKFPKAAKETFAGQIYVLVDGRTYSAGSVLARYLREYGNATMLGEETGTRYEGFAAGSSQLVSLNNTEIEVGIPRYHILFPVSKKQNSSNKGLIPDIPIVYTLNDILDENDLHMSKVRTVINQQ